MLMDEQPNLVDEQWWVAVIGDTLVWARLRVLESGVAQVFDCSGETVPFDGEESARASLLDAEYRAFDGLDDDDAALMGFDLDDVGPPEGDDDALPGQMHMKLRPRD